MKVIRMIRIRIIRLIRTMVMQGKEEENDLAHPNKPIIY